VLYIDAENGVDDIATMLERLESFLTVSDTEDILVFSLNDCTERWNRDAAHTFSALIDEVKPVLVIIDPLTALYPDAEETNAEANRAYSELRGVIRRFGCSICCIHHLKKPSAEGREHLEDANIRNWFLNARGARALINGADVRIGIDEPSALNRRISESEEAALVFAGFGRVKGSIPVTRLVRIFDDDGNPIGYRPMRGAECLDNPEQRNAFNGLPESFRHKDARLIYGKGPQATTDFLKKCVAAGLLRHEGRDYIKNTGPGGPTESNKENSTTCESDARADSTGLRRT
jgi:hypothetical protein